MNLASSDNPAETVGQLLGLAMALTVLNASINQSQKHDWEQLLMGLLFYIILNLYLVVTSRIADLVPTVASFWICRTD